MDVYDFFNLCTDDSAEIYVYDFNEDISDAVFHGEIRDLLNGNKWNDYEVLSFDLSFNGPNLCVNIDTSDNNLPAIAREKREKAPEARTY